MVEVEPRPLFKKLNKLCSRAIEAAAGACTGREHYELTVEHALLSLLEEPRADVALILERFEADPGRLRQSLQRVVERFRTGNTGKPVFSPFLVEWLQSAWLAASVELDAREIRSGALLAAIVSRPDRFLGEEHPELEKVSAQDLRTRFREIVAGSVEETAPAASEAGKPGGGARAPGQDSALSRYAIDFTGRAREGAIDPVFGRDREIRQAIDILARRRKNNPIIVGEAGVGKTAVVEGLALRVVEGDVPDILKGIEIWGLDMGLLQAGAGVKGEFENRLKSVIAEIKGSAIPIVTFIDEAHTLIGAGGSAGTGDAANLLKPALARGELRTIAATTWAEYKKYIEEDAALARRFQLVKLDEPSVADTALMLRGLRRKYEEAHRVRIRDDAVEAAARLSSRYIAGRQLPDKAVDLIDTAAARVKIGLSSSAPVLEDPRRRVEALDRELAALDEDRRGGNPVDEERVAALRAERTRAAEDLAQREERWNAEKAAVDRVLELRGRLSGSVAAPAAAPAPSGSAPAPGAIPEGETRRQLDEALASLQAVRGGKALIRLEVDPEVVGHVVEDWTGIPVRDLLRDEASKILDLGDRLKERIKGQDAAVDAVTRSLRSSKAGLQDPRKPHGVFLLVGPSGVGKTETALSIADILYGGERFLVTINMSEYQDREMGVSGLVGAKPGYVGYGKGGTLTEAVRQRPYSVVLLDEIEKACVEVRNLFYQVFDKGELTDGTGRTVDFKNTVIFITSNLGSDVVQQMHAASPALTSDEVLAAIRPTLSKVLQPAWLARTAVVPYLPLGPDALRQIAALSLGRLAKRLSESHRMELAYPETVLERIAERCSEVETGARNIEHILQSGLLPEISNRILQRLSEGAPLKRLEIGLGPDGGFSLRFDGPPGEQRS